MSQTAARNLPVPTPYTQESRQGSGVDSQTTLSQEWKNQCPLHTPTTSAWTLIKMQCLGMVQETLVTIVSAMYGSQELCR